MFDGLAIEQLQLSCYSFFIVNFEQVYAYSVIIISLHFC